MYKNNCTLIKCMSSFELELITVAIITWINLS